MNRDDNLVEIREVSFGYEERPVLKGLNLQIPRGKVVAIMGTSGCGKTTLLRLIGGQYHPNAGDVVVDGQSVPSLNSDQLFQLRRKMGMLFQFGALFTDLSVYGGTAGELMPDIFLD